MALFEVVYGKLSPPMISYLAVLSKVQEVDNTLVTCADIVFTLKDNLVLVENHIKKHIDQHHSKHHFEEGDNVFLYLKPYN
jgi:hypothetical protein